MFTILIKYKNSNCENLYTADSIEFNQKTGLSFNSINGHGYHFGISDLDEDFRDIFVMNNSGQSVTRIRISERNMALR